VSHINKFKLSVIDYPEEKNIALTEDNQIALFEPGNVISTDSATRNGSVITSFVQYSYPGYKVFGFPNDSSFVRFPSTMKRKGYSKHQSKNGRGTLDSTYAIVLDMKDTITTPAAKYWAGHLSSIQNSGDTVSRYFSRRERKSVTIVPIPLSTESGDYVEFLNMDWLSNFKVKYISLATNVQYNSSYSENGFDIYTASKINLINKTSATTDLVENDSLSATLDSSCILMFKFDVSRLEAVLSGYKRAYILETIGHYSLPSANNSDKIPTVMPKEFALSQNYPNPFNPTTKINFELPRNTQVSLVIYDILGREVIRLANNEFKQAGRHTVEFDARNYASGVYFYRIEAGTFVQSKKMVLIK
jgi:hypothetical protein